MITRCSAPPWRGSSRHRGPRLCPGQSSALPFSGTPFRRDRPTPFQQLVDMPAESLITAYVVVLLAAISAMALYSVHRQRRFGPTPSDDHIFRCEKCGFVYTDDPDVDRSRCPQCGRVNDAIRF